MEACRHCKSPIVDPTYMRWGLCTRCLTKRMSQAGGPYRHKYEEEIVSRAEHDAYANGLPPRTPKLVTEKKSREMEEHSARLSEASEKKYYTENEKYGDYYKYPLAATTKAATFDSGFIEDAFNRALRGGFKRPRLTSSYNANMSILTEAQMGATVKDAKRTENQLKLTRLPNFDASVKEHTPSEAPIVTEADDAKELEEQTFCPELPDYEEYVEEEQDFQRCDKVYNAIELEKQKSLAGLRDYAASLEEEMNRSSEDKLKALAEEYAKRKKERSRLMHLLTVGKSDSGAVKKPGLLEITEARMLEENKRYEEQLRVTQAPEVEKSDGKIMEKLELLDITETLALDSTQDRQEAAGEEEFEKLDLQDDDDEDWEVIDRVC